MRSFSFKRVFNFFNSVRPLIDEEGEIFLRSLKDKEFEKKIENVKKGNPQDFNVGDKDFKINLVRNLDPIID